MSLISFYCRAFVAITSVALLAAQDTSATVSGVVRAWDDGAIYGVDAELRLEESPHTRFSVRADNEGRFKFTILPAGTYTLTLAKRGFRTLTLKSIQVATGEQKVLRPLRVEFDGSCGAGGPILEHLELLPTELHVGNLSGHVERSHGRPIARATVQLLCDERKVCGETKTDSNGEFIFFDLPPRNDITIRVTHPGFYAWEGSGFRIREGLSATYAPTTLDSGLRPKRPLIYCE